MSTKILTTYLGDGKAELVHQRTSNSIITDLPPDNGGKGRTFSPTDLFASSVGSCIATIMGQMGSKRNQDLSGLTIEVEKIMSENPRRIGQLNLNIKFPPHISENDKKKYLHAVQACPVHRSLHPDIKVNVISE